jgi:chromosome segregation ATPase
VATDSDSAKVVWWILGALLMIAIAALSWWGKDLHARLERLDSTYSQRVDTLHQTNALRGERMVAIETRLAGFDPRLQGVEGKLSALEPRLPLVESRLQPLESRLQRIEEKLDRLLSAKPAR